MATDYDLSWPTKHRYDVLHPSKVARTRGLLSDVAAKFGASVLGTARVRDDGIHVRVRVEDDTSMKELIKHFKGALSVVLADEDAAIKSDYKGKVIFGRSCYCATGNPGNGPADSHIDAQPQHSRP